MTENEATHLQDKDQWPAIKLWFFRELSDDQRLALFRLCGWPVDEIGKVHGRQQLALRNIVKTALSTPIEAAESGLLDEGVKRRLKVVLNEALDKAGSEPKGLRVRALNDGIIEALDILAKVGQP